MNMKSKIILLTIVICFSFIVFIQPVFAATLPKILPVPTGTCPEGAACSNGICPSSSSSIKIECNYSLEDFLTVFVNISKIILGLLGAIALIFFVYGGLLFLLSAGSQEKVQQGQNILKGTAMGIIIVLGAWLIVFFVEQAVGLKPEYQMRLVGGKVTTPEVGCCIYKTVASGECGSEDKLVTDAECDTYISGWTPPGTIEKKLFYLTNNYSDCQTEIDRLISSGDCAASVASTPIGCCIYQDVASHECASEDDLLTDSECDEFISSYPSPGTIIKKEWFEEASDHSNCDLRVVELEVRGECAGP